MVLLKSKQGIYTLYIPDVYKNIITNSLKEWKGQEYEKEVI